MTPLDPNDFAPKMHDAVMNLNAKFAENELQSYKLKTVLQEFLIFSDEFALALAECSIVWAFVSLGHSKCRKPCETMFYATVDMCYLATEDAESRISRSQRQEQFPITTTLRDQLAPEVTPVIEDATRNLLALGKDNLNRVVAEAIHQHRGMNSLEYASRFDLSALIGECFGLCIQIAARELGISDKMEESAYNVFMRLSKIQVALLDSVKEGLLSFDECGRLVSKQVG